MDVSSKKNKNRHMKRIAIKFLVMAIVAGSFLSACNKPDDPQMDVMAMGEWYLQDLFMDDQVIVDYSSSFILDLETDATVIFVNHDGIGLTGAWALDEAGTTLTLTPDIEGSDPLVFDVLYLLHDKMGLRQTLTSPQVGTMVFTYILER